MRRLTKRILPLVLILAGITACEMLPGSAEQVAEPPAVITVLVIATESKPGAPTITPAPPTPTATPLPPPSPTPTLPKISASGSVSTALVGPVPEGGSIVVGVVGDMNLDANAMTPFLQSAVYNSLLQPNALTGALEPGLAEAYQVSNDGTTMLFQLRRNLRWHNGEAVTARDVVATITAFASPEFRGTPVTDFGPLVAVSALDDLTVQVVFKESYCPALSSIGTMKIMPRSVVQSGNFPHLTAANVIGTGPLKLVSQGDNQFVFTRNTSYHAGTPHIENWTLKVFPDTAAMRAAFIANQIDLMALAPRDYRVLNGLADANILATESSEIVTLLFNLDTVTLNDARVRQGLSQAVDRKKLLDDMGGRGELTNASAMPGYWANPKDLAGFAFDLGKAKQLLAEAGWRDSGDGVARKDRKPLNLELWTEADDPLLEPLAFRLREMFAAAGVQATLELDDRPGWVTRAFQHRFDMLLFSRQVPLDVDQRWYWQSDQNAKGSGFNFGSYASARVDQMTKESLRVSVCEPNTRAAYFWEMNRNLVADAPAVFLFAPDKYLVAHDRVLSLAPSTFAGDFWNLEDWGVRK